MRSKMSAIGTSDSAFHDGNPSTGELGTIVTSDWLNAVQASTMDVQDELLNVLAAASIANDSAVKTQILAAINKLSKLNMQSGSATFATDTGAENAYVVSLTPALNAPRGEGQVIRFKVANTNTGACTVNDGVSTVPIVGLALSALQGGEMTAGGDAWIQWHPNVGTGSYVLLFCSGAPLQVANATKLQHAVALGQLQSGSVALGNRASAITYSSATSLALDMTYAGKLILFNGAAAQSAVLPGSPVSGTSIEIACAQASGLTITSNGGATNIDTYSGLVSSVVMQQGDTAVFTYSSAGTWVCSGVATFRLREFGANKSTNGYQKLPSGLIIQWGVVATISGTAVTASLPTTFTTTALQGVVSHDNPDDTVVYYANISFPSTSSIRIKSERKDGSASSASIRYFVVGV